LLSVTIHYVYGPAQGNRAKPYMIKDSRSNSTTPSISEESNESTDFTNSDNESGSTSGDNLRIEYEEPVKIKRPEVSAKEALQKRIRRMSTDALEGLSRALSDIKRSKRRVQKYIPVEHGADEHHQVEKEEDQYYDPPIVKLREEDSAVNLLHSSSILEDVR